MDNASPTEIAQKAQTLVLTRLRDIKQSTVAEAMGISESELSKLKNDKLEDVLKMLAHCGLKVVPVTFKCMDPLTHAFVTRTAQKAMTEAPGLVWDAE